MYKIGTLELIFTLATLPSVLGVDFFFVNFFLFLGRPLTLDLDCVSLSSPLLVEKWVNGESSSFSRLLAL